MPTPAIIATQLTDHSARAYTLTIDGVDFLKPYGASWATHYGIPLETIDLTEEGPGGVSSLHFSIDDPNIEANLAAVGLVEFWDIAHTQGGSAAGRPLFLGWIQNLSIIPSGVNRTIDVTCIGVEAVLDWMLMPYLVVPAGMQLSTAVQMLAANATGIGFPLRAFGTPEFTFAYGSQALPVADVAGGSPDLAYDVILDGQSLREAIAQVVAACNTWAGGQAGAYVSVDFYGGLRFFNGNGAGATGILTMSPQADMDTMTVSNTVGASRPNDATTFELDASGVVRAVYIKGQTNAGSGLVSDGSGIVGPVSYLNDTTSTTTAIRNAIANDYLAGFSQAVRGRAEFTPLPNSDLTTTNVRAGSYLLFTADNQTLTTGTYFTIFSIHKTFAGGGLQNWTVSFGGFPPSAVKQLRRLTRDVRS